MESARLDACRLKRGQTEGGRPIRDRMESGWMPSGSTAPGPVNHRVASGRAVRRGPVNRGLIKRGPDETRPDITGRGAGE
jgi:hypothetical protein